MYNSLVFKPVLILSQVAVAVLLITVLCILVPAFFIVKEFMSFVNAPMYE